MKRVLLVDDDLQALESMRKTIEMAGFVVDQASDGQEALEKIQSRSVYYDAVVSDVRMPRLGGLDFLKAMTICAKEVPVVLMTAFGQVEDAVWAMKLGAVDFLTKPFKRQVLLDALSSAIQRSQNKKQETLDSAQVFEKMLGSSDVLLGLKRLVKQVAPTNATVLITGESGTGKELVAQCIHDLSDRKNKPFVALNCAAIPEQLIESELFGYEKGSFSGATGDRAGLFEAANGGTLLLDEIGDMPLSVQAKLLRCLQEGEIRRVGAVQSRKVDVRVLAATHRDLKQMALEGRFRQDLLFRLDVVQAVCPPLRERPGDITELAGYFLKKASPKLVLSSEALEALSGYSWPGNIRELANVIERAAVLCNGSEIGLADLPAHLRVSQGKILFGSDSITIPMGTPLKDMEDILIRRTLEATEGDKNMAAKILGVNSRTIYRKLGRVQ